MDEAIELVEENNASGITLPRSDQPDIIEKYYKINTSEPVTELNTDLCKYFIARHIDTAEEFYAIVFEKSNIYGIEYLNMLKNIGSYPIIVPQAYGITKISALKEYFLVIIVKKYDYSNNLVRRIAQEGPMSYDEINSQLIVPIVNLFQFCEKSNIELGNISPNNIIFTQDGKMICREFFIAPPHYHQESFILAPEIAGCLPYGRITKKVKADIYALGVIIIFAYTGNQNWTKYSDQQYDLMRLETGSFNVLAGKGKIIPDLKNLLKGLLYDNPSERWTVRNIVDWLNGKAIKIVSNDNLDAVSPIVFNEMNFQTCRALAYCLHINWDQAIQFMREERLTKWIQRSLVKTKITESINELFSEQAGYKFSYNQDRDETVFKLLTAFDKHAPMRLKNFAASILSIPTVVYSSLLARRTDYLDAIMKILNKRFWAITTEKNTEYAEFTEYFLNLENSLKFYNPSVVGFTIERLIYSFNPNLPCLSSNLGGRYVTDIADLLYVLNEIVATNTQAQLIDRHIIGFIASKLNLKRELKISSLKDYPQIMSNPSISALSYIFLASQQASSINVTNISSLLSTRLIELFNENLHNIKLKNMLKKDLSDAGSAGNLSQLINIISDSKIIESDFNGYRNACKEVSILNDKITALANKKKVGELGAFFGQRITVVFSYLLITLVSLILVF
ncbi:MAG: hypothetical protein K0R02_137 [Rickettsiaceae bacterium]|jgi:hypothetical protein|nr:hypothetical protein [Rickettsiaceae bacterium]